MWRWRVCHSGDGKVCLHDWGKSGIRAETGHFCTDFFTSRFKNLPVVRKILFVQYLGAALRPIAGKPAPTGTAQWPHQP
jgi:hypothetical protein